jgi:ribose/xylose/arabinose/galactoside ABC-type transport system permease subunit
MANSAPLAPDTVLRPRFYATGKATYALALRLGGLFVAIIVVGSVFYLLNPAFLTGDVMIALLRAMSSVAIMSIGLTFVVICGEIDLSVGAMYGLAANMLAALWILWGMSFYWSILIALAFAVGAGALHGVLTTGLRIPSFIVTLGGYNVYYGLSLLVTNTITLNPAFPPSGHTVDKSELHVFIDLTKQIGSHQFSIEIFWMIALALIFGLLLHRTLFGFRIIAIGGNPIAGRLARLPVRRYRFLAFIICSVLSAIAGILDFSFIQSTQPDAGLAQTFPVFAAVVIGGTSLTGGKGTIIGTLGGALLLAELQIGLALQTLGPYAQQLFVGFVTVGAVTLDVVVTRLRARKLG